MDLVEHFVELFVQVRVTFSSITFSIPDFFDLFRNCFPLIWDLLAEKISNQGVISKHLMVINIMKIGNGRKYMATRDTNVVVC